MTDKSTEEELRRLEAQALKDAAEIGDERAFKAIVVGALTRPAGSRRSLVPQGRSPAAPALEAIRDLNAVLICPKCGKDMSPRPGAVLTCAESECAFWRVG